MLKIYSRMATTLGLSPLILIIQRDLCAISSPTFQPQATLYNLTIKFNQGICILHCSMIQGPTSWQIVSIIILDHMDSGFILRLPMQVMRGEFLDFILSTWPRTQPCLAKGSRSRSVGMGFGANRAHKFSIFPINF